MTSEDSMATKRRKLDISMPDHPFKFLPPLKHMASSKIIETLWRTVENKKELKELYLEECPLDEDLTHSNFFLHLSGLNSTIVENLNKLPLPDATKKNLRRISVPMIKEAFTWFIKLRNSEATYSGIHPKRFEEPGDVNEEGKETISFYMDNLAWNNFGCLDVPSILKSYINNKETIPFRIWVELCEFCMEDDIIKFSKTIDWNKCRNLIESPFANYWYYKIHKKSPSDEAANIYDKEGLKELVRISITEAQNVPAITYFRNFFNDEEFNSIFINVPPELSNHVVIYLLRAMEPETLFKFIHNNHVVVQQLMEWPSLVFVDQWMSSDLFEKCEDWILEKFLHAVMPSPTFFTQSPFFLEDPLDEYYMILMHTTEEIPSEEHFRVLEKAWKIFYRRCESDEDMMLEMFYQVFSRNSIRLCRIMFAGMEESRKRLFIQKLTDFDEDLLEQNRSREGFDEEYMEQFAEEFLDEEQKKFFWENFPDHAPAE